MKSVQNLIKFNLDFYLYNDQLDVHRSLRAMCTLPKIHDDVYSKCWL